MNSYRERRYSSTVLDGGQWSASRPCLLITRERAPGTHFSGGLGGPRAVLDTVKERKTHAPAVNRIPAVQTIARLYTD
jgi:hypothetical protein